MKFEKLRLAGFKSFVEPMEFVIDTGLTGVVGPNGCGKSNLVEALRWVMGENSYKNMRASGMDDVIFSGSATRPSRNAAEVTLFLDNQSRTAPLPFNDSDEVQVSRRIEREAGSNYRINGRDARARDVQLLFADQSTGARSPSMVGQGRIGEIIQAKPQARRQLLEEAAGISGLHQRRHEAELRLRSAETNLTRLDDVAGELEAQIENLKRQARQAKRFKALSASLRQMEATLFYLKWRAAVAAEEEAQTLLNQQTNAVAEAARAQMEAARHQAVAAEGLPALRQASAAAGAALQRLTIARSQWEAEIERARERKAELLRRLEQLSADTSREKELLSDYTARLERLEIEEQELTQRNREATAGEAKALAAFTQGQSRLDSSQQEVDAATAERAEAAARLSQLRQSLEMARQRAQTIAKRREDTGRSLGEAEGQLADLPDPAARLAVLGRQEQAVIAAQADLETLEKKLERAQEELEAARQPRQNAGAQRDRILTEAETLEKVIGTAGDLWPPVIERLDVRPGYETALGAVLGEDLEKPLDEAASAYWRRVDFDHSDPELPQGVSSLADFVDAPAELRRVLAQTGVIDEADGPRLQSQLHTGQCLVSREGAIWRWDGVVAAADAPGSAARRLEQKNRLADLRQSLAAAERDFKDADAAFQTAGQAVSDAQERVRESRIRLQEGQKAVSHARDDLKAAEAAAGAIAQKRTALAAQAEELEQSATGIEADISAMEADLAGTPDIAVLDERLAAATARLAAGRASLADARAAHQDLQREAGLRRTRLEAIGAERQEWTTRRDNAMRQMDVLKERLDAASRVSTSLDEAPTDIEQRRRELVSQIELAEAERKTADDRMADAENRQRDLDRLAVSTVEALSGARENRARTEERLAASAQRRLEIEKSVTDTLNCSPQQARAIAGLEEADLKDGGSLPDIAETERALERQRAERERLGAVNLRAEEEHEELVQRRDALLAERSDVTDAIAKLRQGISNLNREGRERLVKAFETVDVEFQRLFVHLFGGGTAQLQLVESDDPLEAGLEILAQPPGKKPQTMTLLSGGEQALTAMALIFAVFLTNPAPICVLDEVDAPLDDHNVERFCDLMDEMAATTDTKFVIITHNPITMARMNRLFGVTMGEQGVSQLVSVDLHEAEALREAS